MQIVEVHGPNEWKKERGNEENSTRTKKREKVF